MSDTINVTEHLKKLSEISSWFENQEQVDVEAGLVKVKEASVLIQESKKRLQDIQNEFIEVKKLIEEESADPVLEDTETVSVVLESSDEETSPNKIPF